MFKGLIALFTSGIIFNPFVLLGIISGSYTILHFEPEAIRTLLMNHYLYGTVFALAVVYTLVFSRVYKEGGNGVDWTITGWRMVWNFARYFIAFVLTMSFVVMISIF